MDISRHVNFFVFSYPYFSSQFIRNKTTPQVLCWPGNQGIDMKTSFGERQRQGIPKFHVSRVQRNDTRKPQRGPGVAQESLLTWQCWSMLWTYFPLYFYELLPSWACMQRGAAVGCPSPFLIILGFSSAYLLLCALSPCPSPGDALPGAGFWDAAQKCGGMHWASAAPRLSDGLGQQRMEPKRGSCWEIVVQGAFHNI